MKYLKQLMIILVISFAGEILNELLPLPVPSGIYGLLILIACLSTGALKTADIRECAKFLVEIMPVMFVPAAVGLMDMGEELEDMLLALVVMIPVTTAFGMAVTGLVTQTVIRRGKRDDK